MTKTIAEALKDLKDSIRRVAENCRRDPAEIQLVLVTKTVPSARIQEALDQEITDIGENRVQELLEKSGQLPESVRWHMIGHLQTNKVKQVVGKVVLIHSLDRPELFEELEKQAELKGFSEIPCLIQVNASQETSKYGFDFKEVGDFVASLPKHSRVRIQGLMTIGPFSEDEEVIRRAFRETRLLRDRLRERFRELNWDTLSMGMSGDYKIAIEEGSTMIRVGSAVFGPRS